MRIMLVGSTCRNVVTSARSTFKIGVVPMAVVGLWTVVLCMCVLTVNADPEVVDNGDRIKNVAYDKLKTLIRSQNYVIALYTKSETKDEASAESALSKIQGELEEQLSAIVVKTDSNNVAEEFGLLQHPGLVFFRKENAVIYDGAFQEEALLEWFLQNQEPSTRVLTDESFEHLTQAASGSTTGDWFVMFCNASSSACRALQPTWESIAGRLKSRMNVASVDIDNSPQLEKRFRITKNPELIFFRLGKMYRYAMTKTDIPSLSGFALGWYKNAKAELIPQQDTPFDNIITWIIEKLKTELQDPYVTSPIIMLSLPLTLVLAAVLAKGRDYKGEDL